VFEPEKGKMFGTQWAYADEVDPVNIGQVDHCPVCGGAVSLRRWLEPHRVKLSSARPEKWGDFLWGSGFPLIVSGRFKSIYEAEGLTGIAEFSPPVEVVRIGARKTGDFPASLPDYHLICVPWGGANQDDVASEVVHEQPENIACTYCRIGASWRKQPRIILEEGSWGGSDIFRPRAAPIIFMVSERFKQVSETHGLRNIWLIPSEKYGYDVRRPGLWYVRV
jgi:hypothetical protein